MPKEQKKRSIFTRFRNYFIAGVVVLIPIGITLYLTLFVVTISSKILPKEINPNYYLPYNIPGLEIIISIFVITFIGWLSLSFLGKKLFDLFNNILQKVTLPSQSQIWLGKALVMASGMDPGGDLGAIISKDGHILDGHHRWAMTMLSDPTVKIDGVQADLNIGDLVPVLRNVGDAMGFPRRP